MMMQQISLGIHLCPSLFTSLSLHPSVKPSRNFTVPHLCIPKCLERYSTPSMLEHEWINEWRPHGSSPSAASPSQLLVLLIKLLPKKPRPTTTLSPGNTCTAPRCKLIFVLISSPCFLCLHASIYPLIHPSVHSFLQQTVIEPPYNIPGISVWC